MKTYQGIIVDAISKKQFKGEIVVENGKIIRVEEKEHYNEQYILPGLVDAHVHIESSMTMPSVFPEWQLQEVLLQWLATLMKLQT